MTVSLRTLARTLIPAAALLAATFAIAGCATVPDNHPLTGGQPFLQLFTRDREAHSSS